MLIRLLCATLIFTLPLDAAAEWLLRRVGDGVLPGQPIELELVVLNDTDRPMDGSIPAKLPALITTGGGPAPIELYVIDPQPTAKPLAPGQFRKHRLRLTLPPDAQGPVAIELTQQRAHLVLIAPAPTTVAGVREPATSATPAPVEERNPVLRAVDTTPQPALQTHEPMYFVVGRRNSDTTARFQLSFKYRLFDERSWPSRYFPVDKLYVGYTQTSLWDLSQESSPFRDTAYRPSLFYDEPDFWRSADGSETLGYAIGLEHESNGRSDPDSRSINTLFVQPTWRKFLSDSKWYVSVSPKLWAYIDKEDNPEIEDYRGYGDLNLRLGRVDGWLFAAKLRKGTHKMGSVELDASYPIRRPFFANAGGYIHFQYFNGYGESLLDYDSKGPSQFRVGVSIVR